MHWWSIIQQFKLEAIYHGHHTYFSPTFRESNPSRETSRALSTMRPQAIIARTRASHINITRSATLLPRLPGTNVPSHRSSLPLTVVRAKASEDKSSATLADAAANLAVDQPQIIENAIDQAESSETASIGGDFGVAGTPDLGALGAPPSPSGGKSISKKSKKKEISIAEPVASGPLGIAQSYMKAYPAIKFATYGLFGFLGITFVIALVKTAAKTFSFKGRRNRTVNKNKMVVDALAEYLPSNRSGLTASVLGSLKFRTGFNSVEVFRKFLWYLLRERSFDQEAIDDLIALKQAAGLDDAAVAEAVKERAQRIYEKFGNVMLETEGMTKAGVERKATARALFSKMQYLTVVEGLMNSEAGGTVDIRGIFGATEDDAAKLRIVSLYNVDLDKLVSGEGSVSGGEEEEEEERVG